MAFMFSSFSSGELIVDTVVCAIIIMVANSIYRICFHPLSKVPGPLLAKVTDLYSAYHSWRGTMHLDVQRCHKKYGDLIRYCPSRVLSLHTPDLKEIYSYGKPFGKPHGYSTFVVTTDAWSTMTSIDKDLHRNLRRTFRSGISSEVLATYEPCILRNLDLYTTKITQVKDADGWTESADMRVWNLCLGLDTISEFGLGLKTHLLESESSKFILPALYMHEKKMGLWEQIPTLSEIGFGTLTGFGLMVFSPHVRKFHSWWQRSANKAIQLNQTESQGIFSPAFQSSQGLLDKPGHNKAQAIAEGSNSTFSSSDGYAVLLSSFMHFLSHYPRVYDKLASELRCKYQPGQKIQWGPEIESITYLRAVIDETMRLVPPACGVHWRECEGAGVTLGKDHQALPVGCLAGMSLFSLFRDDRVFRDPVLFWPERWIPGVLPEHELDKAKQTFKPFLTGPRGCAGPHVAYMIISIAATYLMVNYDLRLGPEKEEHLPHLWSNTEYEIGSESELRFESHYTVATWKKGPFIQLRARDTTTDDSLA